jgi:hypothetical protein
MDRPWRQHGEYLSCPKDRAGDILLYKDHTEKYPLRWDETLSAVAEPVIESCLVQNGGLIVEFKHG